MNLKRLALPLILSAALSACASIERPTLLEGPTAAFAGEAQAPVTPLEWWRSLNDPLLNALVDKALTGNFSLKAAAERLGVAERIASVAPIGISPSTSASGTKGRTVTEADGKPDSVTHASRGTFNVAWELPLFGKASSTLALAGANAYQASYQLEAARITLASSVLRNYVQLQANTSKRQQLEELSRLAEDTVQIQRKARAAGVGKDADVDAAFKQVLQYQAQAAQLEAEARQLKAAIAVLCGEKELPELESISKLGAPGLPAPVLDPAKLRNRPDVKAAEEAVMAAAAQAGLSRAALWPQLNLSASATLTPGGLATVNESVGLSIPLLNWFALKAQADANVGQMRAAVNDYRQVVLNAWQEVTTAQADLNASARRGASSALQLELAVAQMERVHSLEKAGLSTRLDTLSAQAGVASATMSTADELGQFIQNWARMQKAMYVVGPGKAPA